MEILGRSIKLNHSIKCDPKTALLLLAAALANLCHLFYLPLQHSCGRKQEINLRTTLNHNPAQKEKENHCHFDSHSALTVHTGVKHTTKHTFCKANSDPQELHQISRQRHVWNVEVSIHVLEENDELNLDFS